MKTYTRNQIEAIVLLAYQRGREDQRLPKDRLPDVKPPTIEELGIDHPYTASDDPGNMAKRNSWLDHVGAQRSG